MKNTIQVLDDQIKKLETEVKVVEQLRNIIEKRLIQNQRQTIFNELQIAINAIDINASKRVTLELFIYAIPIKATILLNTNQNYSFKLITLQEIELKIMYNPMVEIRQLWNKTNRLMLFSEFKNRTERLLNKMEAGELDEYIAYSASELLYDILGSNDEFLKKLGIDVTKSETSARIYEIIKQASDTLNFFNR
jgi:hypothetical protein